MSSDGVGARSAFAALTAVVAIAASIVALVIVLQVEEDTVSKTALDEVTEQMATIQEELSEASDDAATSVSETDSVATRLDSLQQDFGALERRQRKVRQGLADLDEDLSAVQRNVRDSSAAPQQKTGGGSSTGEKSKPVSDSD